MVARCQITNTTAGGAVETLSNMIKAERGAGPHYVTDGRWALDIGLLVPGQTAAIKEKGAAGAAELLGIWDGENGQPRPAKGKMSICPQVRYMEAGAVIRIAEEQAKKGTAKEFKRTEWIRRFSYSVEAFEYAAADSEKLYLDRSIIEGMEPFYFDSVFAVDGKSPAFLQSGPSILEPWKFGIMIMPLKRPEEIK